MLAKVPIISWKKIALIYPCELVFGCVIAWILGEDRLSKQRQEQYILRPGNLVNQIFAYKGNFIWTILFVSLACIQIYVKRESSIVLPRDARTVTYKPLLNDFKQYGCKIILKNVLLIITFFFIDNVFILTGGSCSNGNTHSAEQCKAGGGKWEGGFDISGHFCFLVNVSMILWLELEQFQTFVQEQEASSTINNWFKGVITLTVAVLVTWIIILEVTSIYYHTVFEKVIGCFMGYICPAVMYGVIPRYSKLHALLYG